VSIDNHCFFPEEACPWPPCWAALLALVAAPDCALAAKPPEDISFPLVAFDIVSAVVFLESDNEREIPGYSGSWRRPPGTFDVRCCLDRKTCRFRCCCLNVVRSLFLWWCLVREEGRRKRKYFHDCICTVRALLVASLACSIYRSMSACATALP
jgi:hypothetical protein